MKIKLDENLSRRLKGPLSDLGHDVSTAEEEGLLSQPDSEIASAAKREDRIVFTLDLEFADLRKYPPGNHPGVILFRPKTMGPLAVNDFVLGFVKSHGESDLEGCTVIVEPDRLRIRRPVEGTTS